MPDGLPRGGHVKRCWCGLQAVSRADGQWSGSCVELPGSAVSDSPAGSWLVQPLSGRRAAAVAPRAVPSLPGQPCGVAGGCLRLSRSDVWSRRGRPGRAASERWRRGFRAGRQAGRAAGARLAAQCAGAVCGEASGAAGCAPGSVVAGSAGGGGRGAGLADAAAALSLVGLSVLSRWSPRSVPPRPAGCAVAGGLSIGW